MDGPINAIIQRSVTKPHTRAKEKPMPALPQWAANPASQSAAGLGG